MPNFDAARAFVSNLSRPFLSAKNVLRGEHGRRVSHPCTVCVELAVQLLPEWWHQDIARKKNKRRDGSEKEQAVQLIVLKYVD